MLALLAERPMHGYEIISEMAARTGGTWRPSPGSVYPTLQTLEDEGLVTAVPDGGKRSYTLTDAGRRLATGPGGPSPWDELVTVLPPGDALLRDATAHLVGAVDQALLSATHEQKVRIAELLSQARRAVFTVLAEDPAP